MPYNAAYTEDGKATERYRYVIEDTEMRIADSVQKDHARNQRRTTLREIWASTDPGLARGDRLIRNS